MVMSYRLCYVDDNIAYFTDDFKNAYGDDWNDSPYEHNAGSPYEYNDDWDSEENREHGHTHIKMIAFEPAFYIYRPCDRFSYNSIYSVDDINTGAAPWLYCEEAGGLLAGSTIKTAKEWFKKAGVKCGELM